MYYYSIRFNKYIEHQLQPITTHRTAQLKMTTNIHTRLVMAILQG